MYFSQIRRAFLPAALLMAGMAVAGCQTDNPASPMAQAAPVSHHQAALDCWMATEHGRNDLPLDQRADLVNACIRARMAGATVAEALAAAEPRPKAAKSRSAFKRKAKADAKPPAKRNKKT